MQLCPGVVLSFCSPVEGDFWGFIQGSSRISASSSAVISLESMSLNNWLDPRSIDSGLWQDVDTETRSANIRSPCVDFKS